MFSLQLQRHKVNFVKEEGEKKKKKKKTEQQTLRFLLTLFVLLNQQEKKEKKIAKQRHALYLSHYSLLSIDSMRQYSLKGIRDIIISS